MVEGPLSDYHESALVLAATLRFNREEWTEALGHYQRLETVATLKRHVLEARIGIMRCSRELGDADTVLDYVGPILDDPETPDDIVLAARYNRALLLLERTPEDARPDLEWLAADGPHAEEASHHLVALTLDAGDAEACQAAVFAQLNRFGGGSDWANRSFLLLAESYIVQEDFFQARTTVEQLQANISRTLGSGRLPGPARPDCPARKPAGSGRHHRRGNHPSNRQRMKRHHTPSARRPRRAARDCPSPRLGLRTGQP